MKFSKETERQIRNRMIRNYDVPLVNISKPYNAFVGDKSKMWYIGYVGNTLDNAFDYTRKNFNDISDSEIFDLHLIRRDGMMINVASAMARAMFNIRLSEAKKIYEITYKYRMRSNWHEPDESGITGWISKEGILEIKAEGKVIFRISVQKL